MPGPGMWALVSAKSQAHPPLSVQHVSVCQMLTCCAPPDIVHCRVSPSVTPCTRYWQHSLHRNLVSLLVMKFCCPFLRCCAAVCDPTTTAGGAVTATCTSVNTWSVTASCTGWSIVSEIVCSRQFGCRCASVPCNAAVARLSCC
jgi:hypothetical protein